MHGLMAKHTEINQCESDSFSLDKLQYFRHCLMEFTGFTMINLYNKPAMIE